ncbi:class I SAM-dependent methyltransferase [Hasllibacter sp. MH4015]|uniref:class I SAM-dependent methyltransferase n=1 Tax=Hasllibacter sp. MH4015 TaxID=2854029 RepID=UPI001CD26150|nr:class I SAM-dependent methyltransferase [Hasllibacter sp. MH4015]
MTDTASLTQQYDRAADRWGDKMRLLGYADAYLGFLTGAGSRAAPSDRVCDIGCGTGAFAEAWSAIYGPDADITLVEPSAPMLDRAHAALLRRGGTARKVQAGIEDFLPDTFPDHLLLAHVIEHVPDPGAALATLRGWVQPGAKLWLVLSKPHWCNAIIWFQWRHRTFDVSEAESLLCAAGWRLDETYAFPSGPPSRTSRGFLATAI